MTKDQKTQQRVARRKRRNRNRRYLDSLTRSQSATGDQNTKEDVVDAI